MSTPTDGPNPPYGSQNPPPANPYGAPPAQPMGGGYGTAFPGGGAPAEQPKGKGLAIAALVLAIIPCGITNLISAILAIVVLAGKKGGKGLAIAALVIDALVVLLLVALVVAGVILGGTPVDDLKTGQCITADGLTGSAKEVTKIEVVSCGKTHDGEIYATIDLSADDAKNYGLEVASELCTAAVADEDIALLAEAGVDSIYLTQNGLEPNKGDKVACVAYFENGDALKEKILS